MRQLTRFFWRDGLKTYKNVRKKLARNWKIIFYIFKSYAYKDDIFYFDIDIVLHIGLLDWKNPSLVLHPPPPAPSLPTLEGGPNLQARLSNTHPPTETHSLVRQANCRHSVLQHITYYPLGPKLWFRFRKQFKI